MYWTTGSGRIELNITKRIAAICSHPGPCDQDIKETLRIKSIRKQIEKYPNEVLAKELSEYGAWNEDELQNYEENKERILWIACGDIIDGNC